MVEESQQFDTIDFADIQLTALISNNQIPSTPQQTQQKKAICSNMAKSLNKKRIAHKLQILSDKKHSDLLYQYCSSPKKILSPKSESSAPLSVNCGNTPSQLHSEAVLFDAICELQPSGKKQNNKKAQHLDSVRKIMSVAEAERDGVRQGLINPLSFQSGPQMQLPAPSQQSTQNHEPHKCTAFNSMLTFRGRHKLKTVKLMSEASKIIQQQSLHKYSKQWATNQLAALL